MYLFIHSFVHSLSHELVNGAGPGVRQLGVNLSVAVSWLRDLGALLLTSQMEIIIVSASQELCEDSVSYYVL